MKSYFSKCAKKKINSNKDFTIFLAISFFFKEPHAPQWINFIQLSACQQPYSTKLRVLQWSLSMKNRKKLKPEKQIRNSLLVILI